MSEPTLGWVMNTSDATLMLHAQVVWRELRKRELTEPKTTEAREWADLHLRVVRALEERTDAGNALAAQVEIDKSGNYGEISHATDDAVTAWRSAAGEATT